MARLQRDMFPYLVAVAPLIIGLLIVAAGLVFGGSSAPADMFPIPQPAPVGP